MLLRGPFLAALTPAAAACSAGGAATAKLEVAGSEPSASAQMICAPEAVNGIAGLLGVKTLRPVTPTWVDHVYACDYVYANGTMTMSVKESSSAKETKAYADALARRLGKDHALPLGKVEDGFASTGGDAVVRKDFKVLLVDVSKLPAQFGSPPDSRASVAENVAATIMGCWKGD